MFEIPAALVLALIYAIIVGVRKGAHKEGIHGVIAFLILQMAMATSDSQQ